MFRHLARPVAIIGLAIFAPVAVKGQQCAPPASPAFEFQVDVPATAIPDSTHPHPAADRFAARSDDPSAIIVQFIVDTAGVPLPSSFRVLKAPSPQIADSVKTVFPRWRFTPARRGSCRVAQLVQTAVVR